MDSIKIESTGIKILSDFRLDESHRKVLATNMLLLEKFLEFPAQSMDWSRRITKTLQRRRLFTVGDVIKHMEELDRFKNFGKKSYEEIKERLSILLKKHLDATNHNSFPDKDAQNNKQFYAYLTKGVLGSVLRNRFSEARVVFIDNQLFNKFLDLPVDTIEWSVRCANVFKKLEIKTIKNFGDYDDIKLLSVRNFGQTCLKEVYAKIEDYLINFITSEQRKDGFTSLPPDELVSLELMRGILGLIFSKIKNSDDIAWDSVSITKPLDSPIHMIDWSIRASNVFNRCGIKKIRDFTRFEDHDLLKRRNFGRKCLAEVYTKLEKFLMRHLKPGGNANEFFPNGKHKLKPGDLKGMAEYILSTLSTREKKIISKRYGLWDGKKLTLSELSENLGITRERVRQIQMAQEKKIRKLYQTHYLDSFVEEIFNNKLRPLLNNNFGIANKSELLQIIYAIDGEDIGIDLANEFLSDSIFDGKPIFSSYVIEFDNEVVGLNENDIDYYLHLIKETRHYLRGQGVPQDIGQIIEHIKKMDPVDGVSLEKDRISRFLSVSNIPKDSTGKFGLEKWKFFNSYNIHSMAERALMEINQPSHFSQIVLLMNEMFPKQGPFDIHNVHARIGSRRDIFAWVSPGVYGLKRWGLERPPHVKDYITEILKKANRPLRLEQLTEKVLDKCNCKPSSIGWILGDNPDDFACFGNKLYGLSRWK